MLACAREQERLCERAERATQNGSSHSCGPEQAHSDGTSCASPSRRRTSGGAGEGTGGWAQVKRRTSNLHVEHVRVRLRTCNTQNAILRPFHTHSRCAPGHARLIPVWRPAMEGGSRERSVRLGCALPGLPHLRIFGPQPASASCGACLQCSPVRERLRWGVRARAEQGGHAALTRPHARRLERC